MTVVPRPGYSTVAKTTAARLPSQQAEVAEQFTLADVDPIGRCETIIVGPPGSGKTVLAATFPSPFRWIAADGKTCIKSLRWAFKEGRTSLKAMTDLVAYTPKERLEGHYAANPIAFNQMTDMVDFWFSPEELPKWEGGTLVVDSASQVNEWAMNLALEANSKLPTKDKPLSTSHKLNQEAKLRMFTGQQDYKSAIALFEGWIADIRTLCATHNRSLVLLCHEWVDDSTSQDGTRIIHAIKPWFHGQLRDTIPKSFDDVWYMSIYSRGGQSEFKVQLQKGEKRDSKTRWGAFMKKEETADYRYLIAKVHDYHDLSREAFDKKYGVAKSAAPAKPEADG